MRSFKPRVQAPGFKDNPLPVVCNCLIHLELSSTSTCCFVCVCNSFSHMTGRTYADGVSGGWGRYVDLSGGKWKGSGTKCMMRSFVICSIHQTSFRAIKSKSKRMYAKFWWRNRNARGHLEEVRVKERVILKWILKIGWETVDWGRLPHDREKGELLWTRY